MDELSTGNKATISVSDGVTAVAVAAQHRDASALLQELDLRPSQPVLIVAGGAKSLSDIVPANLRSLIEFGVIKAATVTGAAIVDGGTDCGIMGMLGAAVRSSGISNPVIGVAPKTKVRWLAHGSDDSTPLAPGHSHFVLADGSNWGDETALMFDIAAALSTGRRSAFLLAGGGEVALKEVLRAVRANMSIFVVDGTGETADDIAERVDAARRRQRSSGDASPVDSADRHAVERGSEPIDEITRFGNIRIIPVDTDPDVFARQIERDLAEDATLRWAWRQYDSVTRTARQYQRRHHANQAAVLTLGVLVTALVTLQALFARAGGAQPYAAMADSLRGAIVIIPIIVTILVAAAARLRFGPRWILLRGTAETIKSEIYRYRARAGGYRPDPRHRDSPEGRLAAAIGSALTGVTRAEANLAPISGTDARDLEPIAHAAKGDDGMSQLTASRYIQFRIDDQIRYYRSVAAQGDRDVTWLRVGMLAMGGLGTLLAALGVPLAVAVTTAFVGACATYLESLQIEPTITLYNQAATSLAVIRGQWIALSPEDQASRRSTDELVQRAERVMRSEQSGWVREMHEAMTRLHDEEAERSAIDLDARSRPTRST